MWYRWIGGCFVFFFKQKTAYEMLRSLVGSEMCIRDSPDRAAANMQPERFQPLPPARPPKIDAAEQREQTNCLLYTSDAADDLLCVDLGGRRIIKKKKNWNTKMHQMLTSKKPPHTTPQLSLTQKINP